MGARRACKWSIQIRSKTSQVCDFLFYFTMSSCLIRFDRDRSIRLRDAESASRPHSGFWCLNDKIIKELMSVKQKEYLVIMLKLFVHQDICYGQFDYTS
jgi:hypothetical protein